MPRLLIIEPEGGLANRLRAILTADALAEEGKRELVVLWRSVPGPYGMRAGMNDLFEKHPREIKVVPSGHRSVVQTCGNDRLPAIDPTMPEDCLHVKTCFPLASPSQLDGARSYIAGGPYEFWPLHKIVRKQAHRFTKLFQPSAAVRMRMEASPEGRIGIHVRHGDNVWADEQSPLDLFATHLKGTSGNFWLSTDSTKVERWVHSRWLGCRYLAKPILEDVRGSAGICWALADLLLLSQTTKVVGSSCSSFGPLAAAIGGIPFEMVGPQEKS